MTEQPITLSALTRAYEEWRTENPDAFCCLIKVHQDMAGALVADENLVPLLEAQECPLGSPKQIFYAVSGNKQIVIELVEDVPLSDKGYRIYIWHGPRASIAAGA